VLGHSELTGIGPSEEHLPLTVKEDDEPPPVGEVLYLLPRHICPTVNLFEDALIIRGGAIESVERVTARGRENPAVLRGENRELSQTVAR
jgi:D-serine deaminase-like pyridoxal phosphate-dependent protein